MNVKSCFSSQLDPYRAGIEIGESFSELKPEVIFLFPTIHYGNSSDIAEAIYNVLESDNIIVFGNTGAGYYEYNKVAETLRQYPTLQALAEYPSYGEFGPVKKDNTYSKCLFHHMTYVLLFIGDTA